MPTTPKGITYPSNSSPVAVPADIQQAAEDVDGMIVPSTGGTYTGSVSFTQSPSVPTPTSGLHATNKTYVDDLSNVYAPRDIGNLLSDNQASATDTLGNTTGFGSSGSPTVTISAGTGVDGGNSILLTNTTGSASSLITLTGASAIPVDEGETYTITSMIKAQTNTPATRMVIRWVNSSNSNFANTIGNSVAAGANYQTIYATGSAPVGAVRAYVDVQLPSGGVIGDAIYIDRLSLHRGIGGEWAMPGYPIQGLEIESQKKSYLAEVGNLLSENQASGASTSGIGIGGTTLARVSDSLGFDGYAIEVTRTGAGNGYVILGGASNYFAAPYTIPCRPGEVISATVDVWSPTDTQTATLKVRFLNSSGANLVTYDRAKALTTSVQTLTNSVVAPASTAYVAAYIEKVQSGSGAESFRYSRASIHRGAAGVWSLPGVPVTGQSEIAVNGAVNLSGTGTPEGVVTAAPGSTWLQTSGAATVTGMLSWRKKSGTGNTGWVAEGALADTGWRVVSSWDSGGTVTGEAFGSGWGPRSGAAGAYRIRRQGQRVWVAIENVEATASSPSAAIFPAISGFAASYIHVAAVSADGACALVTVSGGAPFIRGGNQTITSGRKVYAASVEYPVTASWPSSLPGSAA